MVHWNPFSKTYPHKCPDGTTKQVYKHPDDAFPLCLDHRDLSFSGKLKTGFLESMKLSAGSKKRVDEILFSIDKRNNGLMFAFRAVYVVYQSDPCTQTDYLSREIAALIEEQQKLRVFDASLSLLANLAQSGSIKRKELLLRLDQIIDAVDSNRPQSKTIAHAFETSREAARSPIGMNA